MKNKKIIIALLIIILIAVAGTIYYKAYNKKINQEEAYIKIYIGMNVGMTDLYVPESCYEINKSGTIKYIGNVDEKEFDILGRIKKGKFKELEEMIMNAPEDSFSSNNDYWKDYGNKYYHIEVLNNRYRTTNYAGQEIVKFIEENTESTVGLLSVVVVLVGISGVLVYLIYTKIVIKQKTEKGQNI